MQTIVLILVLAITVEALIQYSKTIIEMLEKKQYKTFATQLTAIRSRSLSALRRGRSIHPCRRLFHGSVVGYAAHRYRRLPRFQLYQRFHQKTAKPGHWGDRFGGRDWR